MKINFVFDTSENPFAINEDEFTVFIKHKQVNSSVYDLASKVPKTGLEVLKFLYHYQKTCNPDEASRLIEIFNYKLSDYLFSDGLLPIIETFQFFISNDALKDFDFNVVDLLIKLPIDYLKVLPQPLLEEPFQYNLNKKDLLNYEDKFLKVVKPDISFIDKNLENLSDKTQRFYEYYLRNYSYDTEITGFYIEKYGNSRFSAFERQNTIFFEFLKNGNFSLEKMSNLLLDPILNTVDFHLMINNICANKKLSLIKSNLKFLFKHYPEKTTLLEDHHHIFLDSHNHLHTHLFYKDMIEFFQNTQLKEHLISLLENIEKFKSLHFTDARKLDKLQDDVPLQILKAKSLVEKEKIELSFNKQLKHNNKIKVL